MTWTANRITVVAIAATLAGLVGLAMPVLLLPILVVGGIYAFRVWGPRTDARSIGRGHCQACGSRLKPDPFGKQYAATCAACGRRQSWA